LDPKTDTHICGGACYMPAATPDSVFGKV